MDRAEAKAIIAGDALEAGIWVANPAARANRVVNDEDPAGFAASVTGDGVPLRAFIISILSPMLSTSTSASCGLSSASSTGVI